MEYYGNNDWWDYLAHHGVKGMKWKDHKYRQVVDGEYIYGYQQHSKAYNRALNRYKNLVKQAKRAGLKTKADRKRSSYGNIDLNNRAVIEWDDEKLKKHKAAYESLGYKEQDLRGSKSTVMGESRNYRGLEVALSPLVQKKKGGANLIDSKTIDTYINKLMDKLSKKGDWTSEDLYAADKKGLKIGKTKVHSIIADIGDTAIKTGEQMHFLGKDGALKGAKRSLKKAKKKDYNKNLNKMANDVILGKYGSGNARRKAIEKMGVSYGVVQNRVNKLLGSSATHKTTKVERKKTRKFFSR